MHIYGFHLFLRLGETHSMTYTKLATLSIALPFGYYGIGFVGQYSRESLVVHTPHWFFRACPGRYLGSLQCKLRYCGVGQGCIFAPAANSLPHIS